MTYQLGVRLPFKPLEEAVLRHCDNVQLRLGISNTSIRKYRQRGLSWVQADHLAVKAGYCPFEIWPFEWGDVPIDDIDDDTEEAA